MISESKQMIIDHVKNITKALSVVFPSVGYIPGVESIAAVLWTLMKNTVDVFILIGNLYFRLPFFSEFSSTDRHQFNRNLDRLDMLVNQKLPQVVGITIFILLSFLSCHYSD